MMRLGIFPAPRETIAGVGPALREGRLTCGQLLEGCLARIDQREPEVRAWVLLDRDGARAQAAERDAERASGRWRGPLHGIPVGIKDIIDVAGQPTAAGSRLWVDHATADAEVVARLRAAGAVILGKTVTTAYAAFDPPVTANPWANDRTPGGSSSGSAAAVACRMCLGAIGSQTGGSITRPASFCGVAGLKPTHGCVSLHGIRPLAPSLDHVGPIARTVADLELLWKAMAGPDPGGNSFEPGADPLPPPRLGRLHGIFDELADAAMRAALGQTVAVLEAAGATLTEPPLPSLFGDVLRRHRVIMAAEAAALHEHRLAEHPDDYPPKIRGLIEQGTTTTAPEYLRCREHQRRLGREILSCFDGVDALIVPATLGPAPERSTTGDPAFNSPWSYTGLPVVSLPIGLAPDGLPLAIQLVGRPFTEARLFATARWCEESVSPRRHGEHGEEKRRRWK
jgi:Asp-tRNA(Asn)/Glu-tRNA(Gln) amidotransferase A subunit family amidase